jgi:hypothetical protein
MLSWFTLVVHKTVNHKLVCELSLKCHKRTPFQVFLALIPAVGSEPIHFIKYSNKYFLSSLIHTTDEYHMMTPQLMLGA